MSRLKVLLAAIGLWFGMGPGSANAQSAGSFEIRTIAQLEQACLGGDAVDCDELGMRHLRGDGTAKDPKNATSYFQRACDRGDAPGCFNLGESYQFGDGVPKDPANAAVFYLRACDGREKKGCSELALSYRSGNGVERNDAKAALYADRSCALKSPLGCAILGMVYADGVEGYPQNLEKAKDLLWGACHEKVNYTKKPDEAAQLACPALAKVTGEPACMTLSVFGSPTGEVRRHCFDAEAGWVTTVTQNKQDDTDLARVNAALDEVDRQRAAQAAAPSAPAAPATSALDAGNAAYARKDYAAAAGRFAKACDAGSVAACGRLGEMYASGQGVAANGKIAAPMLAKACDTGIATACGALGGLYDRGNGVTVNKALAFRLYDSACNRSVIASCHDLGRLYESGEGTGSGSNTARSEALYKRGCEANFVLSCYSLGSLFFSGGYSADGNSKAINWYKVACAKGYKPGCDQAQLLELQSERFALIAEQNRQYALMEKKSAADAKARQDAKKDPLDPRDCLKIPKKQPLIVRERKDLVYCDVVNGCESEYREGINFGALLSEGWSNQCKKSIEVHLTYNKEPVWALDGKSTYVMQDEVKLLAPSENGFYPKYVNPVVKRVTWAP
ncbi:tetratricopeptide repeat protein [Novosphingobium sp.]|uniref:tetratricopeptide repeat protein n=1 Tax=Novosphingobium sp. TaxID=1874826 RepID=UPI002601FADE|nr:tetratricopeptide repeat protein [Novosphingobium sp.]